MSAFKATEENMDNYYFDMRGTKVLRLSARMLPGFLNDTLLASGITLDEISVIVPHQASRALDMIMPRIGIEKGKYINRVSEYGNMISASIPYTLCDIIHEGKVERGDKLLLMGTAAGLTSNIVILKY